MLKIFVIVLFYAASFPNETDAQIKSQNDYSFSKNVIFGEIGGNGLIFSLNYERLFTNKFGARIGIGSLLQYGLDFPIMLNYYIGNYNNKLELGIGIIHAKVDIYEKEETTFINSTIGLRHQYPGDSAIIRVSFTPLYDLKKKKLLPWGGLSLGFSF